MSSLVLHIGTHKTGSTTIQDTFWANSRKLAYKGLVYPKLDYQHTGHHGLIAESVGLPNTFHLETGGKAAWERINAKYSKGDHTVFLSTEEFSRADRERSVDFVRLRNMLSGFDSISVLCFLRPQWRFLQSIYLEISRTRSPPRPPEMIVEAINSGRCQGLYLDYTDLLDRLGTPSSSDEITLVDFEAVRQNEGGLIAAALGATGVDLDASDLMATQNGHSNRSPHALSQWAANLLVEPYPATDGIVNATQGTLGSHEPSCLLTRGEIASMNQAFSASNQTLIEARGPYQLDFQLSDPPLPNKCKHREEVTLEDWLKIGRELARPLL